jgi:hypothetical protein
MKGKALSNFRLVSNPSFAKQRTKEQILQWKQVLLLVIEIRKENNLTNSLDSSKYILKGLI